MKIIVSLPEDATEAQLDEAAWQTFATAHPHEAFAKWPERFLAFAHRQAPGVTREQIEALLRETEGEA